MREDGWVGGLMCSEVRVISERVGLSEGRSVNEGSEGRVSEAMSVNK